MPELLADRITGMNAAHAVLAALLQRERSGAGQALEIPMFETMAELVLSDHLGGLLFDPIEQYAGNPHLSRLIAIMSIGLLTGLFSGIIENAIKAGWFKVESGLIAGKQFVLYRNPTFIGSHPMSHIYLFNDVQIGKRHACVHIIGNGYEIEDLPLGTRTYVNGKPVSRARLHNGDEVRVGKTVFKFQEKAKAV